MNSRDLTRRHAVIHLSHPVRDWAWRLGGALSVALLLGWSWQLDQPEEPENPDVTFARGVAEGRLQMQMAHIERNRQAYQAGLTEASMACRTSRQ